MSRPGPAAGTQVINALLLLVLVAAGARVAYELLAPVLPTLISLLVVGLFLTFAFRR